MTNIKKIRQEIERLIMINKTKNGFPAGTICAIRIEVYEKLLSFIDSLPEESQMPMPEDTVIFQKGVAEGRRLEREDNNKALAEIYGYEGGTESELMKITFIMPKKHLERLMPIKQGDVFGIENLTNKEGIR